MPTARWSRSVVSATALRVRAASDVILGQRRLPGPSLSLACRAVWLAASDVILRGAWRVDEIPGDGNLINGDEG
jgi:hypothetical protein